MEDEACELRVEASPEAVAWIQERGSRLYVYADSAGLLHTKFEAPPGAMAFEELWLDGFQLNLDRSIAATFATWYVILHKHPWHHLEVTPYRDTSPAFGNGA